MKKIMKSLCGFFLVALINQNLIAQEKPKPTVDDYGALPTMSFVCVSPDGDQVGFRKVDADNNSIIAVYSRKAHKVIHMVSLGKIKPLALFFVDNNLLIFKGAETTKVEGFRGRLDLSTGFLIDVENKAIRQLLIPGENGIFRGQSGLGNVVGTSPDKNFVYMTAYMGEDHVDPMFTVLKVNVRKKASPIKMGNGNFHLRDFFLDKQGNVIAREGYNEKAKKYFVSVQRDGNWVDLFSEIVDVPTKNMVGLTPDYKSLVFFETDEETNHDGYFLMNLETGAVSKTDFGKSDVDIAHTLTDKNRIVQGVVYDGFTPSYKFFDETLDKRFQAVLANFPEQNVDLLGGTDELKSFLLNVNGSNFADNYFLAVDGQEPQFITSGRPNVSADFINPIGKVTYKARDDLKIPTILTIPKDRVQNMKNLPAILMPHGGPMAHDSIDFDWMAQALATQGYLVIQPQFRGSTGFGADFERAGHGEWGGKMQDDLTDAVSFFVKKGYVDPHKICIVGGSYGGYAALAGGAFTPNLYKCIVSINGVSDLNDFYKRDKFEHGSKGEFARAMSITLAKGEVDSKKLAQTSPVKFAKNFMAPVLLVHGELDSRVNIEQSKDMASALKDEKKSVEFIPLEGDDHHLSEGKTRKQALNAIIKFVNENINK